MQLFRDLYAIAKGMSVTFREMFAPTVVENYPDGPGPLKGDPLVPIGLSFRAQRGICS